MDVSAAEGHRQQSPAPTESRSEPERTTRPGSAVIAKTLIVGTIVALGFAWATATIADRFRRVENIEHGVKYRGTRLSIETATRNSAIAYALVGAGLSLSAGVTAGSMLGPLSVARVLSGGITGILLGVSLGGASAYVLTPIYFARMETADVTLAVLLHMGIWASIGAAAGAAFGVGAGGRNRLMESIVGGLVGAAVGSLVFDVCGAFFPFARTERPLSEEALTRLVSAMVLSLFIVAGIVIVAFQKPAAGAKLS